MPHTYMKTYCFKEIQNTSLNGQGTKDSTSIDNAKCRLNQFKEVSLSDLETLIKISRKTFTNAFEQQNNPINFKNYMSQAFDENEVKN